MKLLVAAIAALCSLAAVFPAPAAARAAGAAPRFGVAGDDAYFCESADEDSSLFEIPPTYCAQILSEEDGWYFVEYAEDDGLYIPQRGYVRTDKLTIAEKLPEAIYLYCPVTVTYTADSGGRKPLPTITVTAAYYGVYDDGGSLYSYVYDGSGFGYVKGDVGVYSPNVPAATVSASASPSAKPNVKLIVALSMCAAAAVALAALYFFGKRGYRPKKDRRQ